MKGAYLGYLVCLRCGVEVPETQAFGVCRRCDAENVPANVLPAYDLDRVRGWQPDNAAPGLFRYRALLPVAGRTAFVSIGEGRTPLVRQKRIGAQVGVEELYFKNESSNPTWSYKDRLAAVAVTKAKEMDSDTLIVATTGNHGAAVAAYAAAANLRCVVLTEEAVPSSMKVLMQSYGARVVALRRGPERWKLMEEAVRGWTPMSNYNDPPAGSNPFGVDGYKTIAYEVAEDLGEAPDVVVVPASYGDGLTGILRGFEDLATLGRTSKVPRMVAAEPFGTYANTLEKGLEVPERVADRPTVAFSTAAPVGTYQALYSLRRSGGTAVAVPTDEEIVNSMLCAARLEGLFLEASTAVAIPVVAALAERGEIAADHRVVVIATSTGLKDVGAAAGALGHVPVIEADLETLENTLTMLARGA